MHKSFKKVIATYGKIWNNSNNVHKLFLMQAHTYFPPLSLSLIIVGGKKRKRKEEDGFEIGGKGGNREEGVQLYGRMCYSRRQRRNWKGCKEYFVISVSYWLCSVVFVVVGGRVLGFVPLTIGGRGLC